MFSDRVEEIKRRVQKIQVVFHVAFVIDREKTWEVAYISILIFLTTLLSSQQFYLLNLKIFKSIQ